MEELLRYHIVSCGDEFLVLLIQRVENINAETETGEPPRKDSKPKTEAKLSRVGKEVVL